MAVLSTTVLFLLSHDDSNGRNLIKTSACKFPFLAQRSRVRSKYRNGSAWKQHRLLARKSFQQITIAMGDIAKAGKYALKDIIAPLLT